MQLVAILCDEDSKPIEAVLYNPATDRLVTAAPGERLGEFTLASIGPTGIVVVPADAPGAREQRLALRETSAEGGS